jgi:DNA modification methylase
MRRLIAERVRVQMCVTSPPYWGLRDYGCPGQLGLESTPQEYVAAMVDVFRLVRELLADDGTLWLNLGDSYVANGSGQVPQTKQHIGSGFAGPNRNGSTGLKPKDLVGIPWRVAFALQADGWYLRQDLIWSKPNPMPESVRDRCTKSHEYIFLLSKNERYFYDADAIAEPVSPSMLAQIEQGYDGYTRNKRSVWTVTTKPFSGAHFATFPPGLIEPCILAGSRPGDTVLDPFFGSGTVGEVAENLGRKWIGCELHPDYIPLAEKRTAQSGLVLA